MIYQLNTNDDVQDEYEYYTAVSPARIWKMLRLHRRLKKAVNGLCLAVSCCCIGVSLLVFGYILLG